MKRIDITIKGWSEYELLDSGEGRKLEQVAGVILDRPDPQTLWEKTKPDQWSDANAQFVWADKGERWALTTGTPEAWNISWQGMKLGLQMRGFKHVGVFPEHSYQWAQLQELGKAHDGLTMLNLFGYTGAASVAAALVGIKVTHVDASKSTIDMVKENAALSGLPADAIRVVCEDVLRYARRLMQRGERFDIIVMDPPAFGRGPKGEVWKIEESLAELVSLLPELLTPDAKLVILNGYAAGYSARTFGELLSDTLPDGTIEYGEVSIQQKNSDRLLTTGIYAAWRV